MTLSLRYAFTITADLAEPRLVGLTPAGYRRIIGITGGTVAGPDLTGVVLPGGADWNVVRSDGAIHVWARYEICSADGAVISVINEGLGRPAAAGLPGPGSTPAAAAPWSCPTRPVFEVAAAELSWLNTGFFLGELRPACPDRVTISVHQVVAEPLAAPS